MPINLFYSFSEEDIHLQIELEKHLSLLMRQGKISGWHFRKITAGKEFKGEIDNHINAAQIILLLISSDFLSSDYCWDIEMKKAMEMHESGISRVIPVILRPCDWESSQFGKLEALPINGKPITKWKNQDEAFLDIVKGIKNVILDLNQRKIPITKLKTTIIKETKDIKTTSSTNVYCTNCGVKIGKKISCVSIWGHDYQSFTGNVYCKKCGIMAGERSECLGIVGHEFSSFTGNVYCANCGVKIGKKISCVSIWGHYYQSYTGNVYCTKCGIMAGERSECNSLTGHEFKSYT
jgi:hypothetical protein